jgi:hypothetical protein
MEQQPEEQKEHSGDHMEDVTSGAAAAASSSSSSGSSTVAKRPAGESTPSPHADQSAARRAPPPRHQGAEPTQPKAVQLHRDAMQSIFQFLPPREFVVVTRGCQQWRDIAVKMPALSRMVHQVLGRIEATLGPTQSASKARDGPVVRGPPFPGHPLRAFQIWPA